MHCFSRAISSSSVSFFAADDNRDRSSFISVAMKAPDRDL
jgi:hypothetical protein